jgi:hypothetical protein
MKSIYEIYPELETDGGNFYGPGNYQPMLDSFGYDVLLQVDDDDYQGDSRILYEDGNRYGILIFGWGSCSGCDSLQGCDSYQEIENLRAELHNGIMWFDSATHALDYFIHHDWGGDYGGGLEWSKRFVKESIKILKIKQEFLTDKDFELEGL